MGVVMSERKALIVLWGASLLALFGTVWCLQDFLRVHDAMQEGTDTIPFDSGRYYVLLTTVFWVLTLIQYVGLKRGVAAISGWAAPVTIAWFAGTLALAHFVPNHLIDDLTSAGYKAVDDPREVSRISRGTSLIFVKAPQKLP